MQKSRHSPCSLAVDCVAGTKKLADSLPRSPAVMQGEPSSGELFAMSPSASDLLPTKPSAWGEGPYCWEPAPHDSQPNLCMAKDSTRKVVPAPAGPCVFPYSACSPRRHLSWKRRCSFGPCSPSASAVRQRSEQRSASTGCRCGGRARTAEHARAVSSYLAV